MDFRFASTQSDVVLWYVKSKKGGSDLMLLNPVQIVHKDIEMENDSPDGKHPISLFGAVEILFTMSTSAILKILPCLPSM